MNKELQDHYRKTCWSLTHWGQMGV